jgi:hypothetical protein
MDCCETLEGMSLLLPIFKAIALQGFASSWCGIASRFGVNQLKEQLL